MLKQSFQRTAGSMGWHFKPSICRLITATGLAALINVSISSGVRAEDMRRPLLQHEMDKLHDVAATAMSSRAPTAAVAANIARERPRELLLIERRPLAKNTQSRQANAYYYDYNTNETIHLIVDVQSQAVLSEQRTRKTQLPLTDNEQQRAITMVFNHPQHRPALDEAFLQITGYPLDAINNLDYKAFVYQAPSGAVGAAQQCGLYRCAQLLIHTADNFVLDISPIVDLSNEIVLQASTPGNSPTTHGHGG